MSKQPYKPILDKDTRSYILRMSRQLGGKAFNHDTYTRLLVKARK